MRGVVARDENDPASVLVEAVHDPGTRFAADSRQLLITVQQRVDQRAAIAFVVGSACPGVDHHARGLIHHHQVVIFIEHVERDVFGHGAQRRRLRVAENGDALAAFQFQRRFGSSVVKKNLLLGHELLHPRAAGVGKLRGKELVEALPCGFGGN